MKRAFSIILSISLLIQSYSSLALAQTSRVQESLHATEELRIENLAKKIEQITTLNSQISEIQEDLARAVKAQPGLSTVIQIEKTGLVVVAMGITVLLAGSYKIRSAAKNSNPFAAAESEVTGSLISAAGALFSLVGGSVAGVGHYNRIVLSTDEVKNLEYQLKIAKRELKKLQLEFRRLQ